ncbi:MAG: hypothetical protein ISR87_00985 [Candidatus Marinimicrobia bacterium]|nr:hypothetical protein [FCB group bacterium]MBL7024000.1 hypothetical protein [Candidatus Neomarinimicrobiota bacterium]
MKNKSNIVTIVLLGLCTLVMGQTDPPDFEQFIGDWQGEGHFYNVNLGDEVGVVRFTLRVTPDLDITGSVGNAQIVDAEIEVDDWNGGYSIKGSIQGQIFPNSEFHKKRITLLMKAVHDNATIGDFHLANNFIFDLSMRPGAITLRKNP